MERIAQGMKDIGIAWQFLLRTPADIYKFVLKMQLY